MKKERVAVLGASPKPERFSNRAVRMLKSHGHEVLPVNPTGTEVEGFAAATSLSELKEPVDTLSVYVGPQAITPAICEIVKLRPGRVILNPGAEAEELKAALDEANIPYLEACTLILLSTGEF